LKLVFSDQAWDDYLYWQTQDKKMLERINKLIRETQRTPFEGLGKPEALKHALSGF
jgi:toxin YoeB